MFDSWNSCKVVHRQRLERQKEKRKVVGVKGHSLRHSGFVFIRAAAACSCCDVTLWEAGVSVLTDPGRPLVHTSGAPFRTIRGAEDDDKKKA